MKIVEPSVTLVHCTPNPERIIERMGRICYQSEHKIKSCANCCGSGKVSNGPARFDVCHLCDGTGTDIESAVAFVKRIKIKGHESVLEHASAGFSIVTDRGVTHEIVRHRLASYSQESTRYCNYTQDRFGGEVTFIQPPDLIDGAKDDWLDAVSCAAQMYLVMQSRNVAPEIARSVLPNSLKSEIGMTANFREWRHFLRLRTSPRRCARSPR